MAAVLDQVAELGVLVLADRGLERDRLLGDLLDLAHPLGGDLELLGDLRDAGLAAEVLEELALHAREAVDRLDHVDGHADGARLVGDGPRDGLADPPGGVGRELVALAVVELLDRPDEPEVALLDEVEEGEPAAHVALGDRDHEAQVGLDEDGLGGHVAPLDALGERYLLRGRQQGYAADLAQVHAHGVVGVRLDRQVEPGAAAAGRLHAVLEHLDVELGEDLEEALLLLLVEVGALDDVGDAVERHGAQLAPLVDQLLDLLEAGDRDLGAHRSPLRAARTRRARSRASRRPASSPAARRSDARRSSMGSSTR